VLVLSGETTPEDVEAAAEVDKPDFVFDSLDDVDRMMFGECPYFSFKKEK